MTVDITEQCEFNEGRSRSSSTHESQVKDRKATQRCRSTSAVSMIRHFESAQSTDFREYRSWKESKWGEDNLDEVEFEDDDMNLELSLPTIFSNPMMPSLSEFSSALESLFHRTVAYALSLSDLVFSADYYLYQPRELLEACGAALALWCPHPPVWLYRNFMDVVGSQTSNLNTYLGGSSPAEDADMLDDNASQSTASALAAKVSVEASRLSKILIGFLFGLLATVSFAIVYLTASIRLLWNNFVYSRWKFAKSWTRSATRPDEPESKFYRFDLDVGETRTPVTRAGSFQNDCLSRSSSNKSD